MADHYVDLHRRFVAAQGDEPIRAEDWSGFGLDAFRGLGWSDLLERPRVVVLAEASAGKSEEFRAQVTKLKEKDAAAFFLTVETIVSNGLDGSLGRQDADKLAQWRSSDQPAWFFLDSVDEARINDKDVERGLNRFARELGEAYDRARVLLSCRGGVWAGKSDLELVERTLPVTPTVAPLPPRDPHEVLLSVLDSRKAASAQTVRQPAAIPAPPPAITVVVLTKITASQREAFLAAREIADVEAFERALFAANLTQFAERPGDLAMLCRYWKLEHRFAGLTEMTDLGIRERLAERGSRRRTLTSKTEDEIRAGVERLAAALTLGRSMNLRVPGADNGGIDPLEVLGDWQGGEVELLLQRGLFVPSTFGLVRFYHRSAQEYLTARWFERLGADLTDPELMSLFVNAPFGVETVPLSLRATAGWLAQSRAALRDRLIALEPLILITQGDPAKLDLARKKALLDIYADRQAAGTIAYANIDHQSLWMFAEPDLADTINAALVRNTNPNFRYEMLRLIVQGKIVACAGALRVTATDGSASTAARIVAARGLAALGDEDGLSALATDIMTAPEKLTPDLAPYLALVLFPAHLSVKQLLALIEKVKAPRQYSSEGFTAELATLFDRCVTTADKWAFLAGLSKLMLAPPFADWPKLSKRFYPMAEHLPAVAKKAIVEADASTISPELLAFLVVIERAGQHRIRAESRDLPALIRARPTLKRALFWADVRTAYVERPEIKLRTTRNLWPGGWSLWSLEAGDNDWLTESLTAVDVRDQETALSGLITIARAADQQEQALDTLAERIAGDAHLTELLSDARRPADVSAELAQYLAEDAAHEKMVSEQEQQLERFWISLRDRLQADPASLGDPVKLEKWPGCLDLLRLSNWLGMVSTDNADGAHNWRALEDAFGLDVAEAYRDGMKIMWRVTPPERPKRGEGGVRTVKHSIILSMAGLELEMLEPEAMERLNPAEAELAARHICLDDQGIPEWLGSFIALHEAQALPPILSAIDREWKSADSHRPLLERAAYSLPLGAKLRLAFMSRIESKAGDRVELSGQIARLLSRMDLNEADTVRLAPVFERRLAQYLADAEWPAAMQALATLFDIDAERAMVHFTKLLAAERKRRSQSRAYDVLTTLFGRHHGLVADMEKLGVARLKQIVREAYVEWPRQQRRKSAEDDEDSGHRDRFDEAGGRALNTLLGIDGPEAYQAMLDLARDKAVGASGHRLMEIAHEMAERNAERQAWGAAEVRAFEARKLAPIASGDDLFDLTCRLLDAVAFDFVHANSSARKVVETAADEAAVQEWLGHLLEVLANTRINVARESQIANDDRPDLVVFSGTTTDEVAIEMKHGEKAWTFPDLQKALRDQLAERYLQTAKRRHGVLVISNHRKTRFWRDQERKKQMRFAEVIDRLDAEARQLSGNSTGRIRVAVKGIDASPGRAIGAWSGDGGEGS